MSSPGIEQSFYDIDEHFKRLEQQLQALERRFELHLENISTSKDHQSSQSTGDTACELTMPGTADVNASTVMPLPPAEAVVCPQPPESPVVTPRPAKPRPTKLGGAFEVKEAINVYNSRASVMARRDFGIDEEVLDMQTREYYQFGESTWDLAIFIGTGALGPAGSFQLCVLLVMNVAMQAIFVGIAWFNFFSASVDARTIEDAAWWRRSTAHSLAWYDPVSGSSLASRVCGGDKSLHISGIQMALYEDIKRYLKPNAEGLDAFLNGQVLCLVALICWYLMVIKEVSHALALHRGISAVASGPSRLEPRENPFTQVTHYRLTSISPMRRACSGMLLLYRLFAAVLLIYVGTVFLVYTVSVTDLILNAVALGIILEIDDLIFDALATTPGRHLVHHLEPLPMPSFPRWRGADVKSLSMSLLIPGLVCLVYFTMLALMVENLREVAEQLCGGTHNFVWSVDKRGVTVMAATNLHRDRVADKLHAKAMEEMFQATDLLSETGFPGRNWTYAATVDSLDFLKAMTTLHEEDVIDITNPSCGNLADQDPPMLAVLRHTLGNESIEGCKDVQSYCNSVSAPVPGKGPDEGRGYVTRMVCSDTCGCGDPGGMFAYVQGCPYGDNRPCSTIPKFRDEIYQATCEERTPELLRQHEPWLSWVEVIRNWATAGGNLDGQEEALLLAQALYDHGCGFGENLTAQNVTWGDCHEWNEDFDWDFKTVAFFCPETCQCTAATRESSCPFPRGKGCDQLKDCVLQRQQYYCIGDPGVDRIQGGIGIAYSSADFAIVKLTLRRALVKLLGVPWRAVTVNIFFVEVYFDVWRTPLPGVDLDSVEQILMGVDKEQFLQAWNQQLAANQLSQLKVSVTYFQVASKGTDEEG
ncbi:unnamed protein product [Effrenium voratum]|uniref:Uncharacterized protein n=1 Tax=Effrenium voratum TaxID=2562239 RepID=A0AA36HKS7_9DINO|nr:unnamed protein product [Effrenium voratum]